MPKSNQTSDRPLFIPLKSEYYDAFDNRSKTWEYRIHGPRWNRKTCFEGRDVTISKGYGKKNRLHGEVGMVGTQKSTYFCEEIQADILAVYGEGVHDIIAIEILLEKFHDQT